MWPEAARLIIIQAVERFPKVMFCKIIHFNHGQYLGERIYRQSHSLNAGGLDLTEGVKAGIRPR